MQDWAEMDYPLGSNSKKWSNTLKTIRRLLPTNCFSVLDLFVGLALKGLNVGLERFRIHCSGKIFEY